jgi:hypothetical protein
VLSISKKDTTQAIEASRNSITNNMSEDMQIVAAYTEECKRSEGSTVTPPQKTQRASTRLSTTQSSNGANNSIISLPMPNNQKEYTKPEAVQISIQYAKGSKDIGIAMREMIRLEYVPVGELTLRRLLIIHGDGQPILNTPWTKGGRRPLASLEEVKSIAENEMEHEHGRV